MGFKDLIKTTKGKVIVAASGTVVVAAAITAAVLMQGSGYRTINCEQVTGEVAVTGLKNNGQAYVGEHLYSGDDVNVGDASELVMLMDSDKYVYADANTHFTLEASSADEDSRIKINLDKGSELNELQSKLGPNDTYEVDTPNSTMSVRGTKFRVTVYTGTDGLIYTLLEVESGEVLCKLKTSDGAYNGVEQAFTAGQSVLIRGNSDFSEFVLSETGEIVRTLDYNTLPKGNVDRLIALLEESTQDTDSDNQAEASVQSDDDATAETETTEEAEADDADDADTTDAADATDANHVHKAGGWTVTVPATCEKAGVRVAKCSCGKVMATEAVPATGHVPGAWVTYQWAGCTGKGGEIQNCAVCGKQLKIRDIPAVGHDWSGWSVSSAPTCTGSGTETRTCSGCGVTESNSIAATGHSWGAPYFAPGPQPGALIRYHDCTVCGVTEHLP